MQTFANKQEAIEQLIIHPLKDAGLDPADYDVDRIAAKVMKKNRYGRFERTVSSVQFWQIVESAAKY